MVADLLGALFIVGGLGFFLGGSIGILRLPDVYSRLHALTKADNLGLGLLIVGLLFSTENPFVALKLVATWLLVLASSAVSSHLIAKRARRRERGEWTP